MQTTTTTDTHYRIMALSHSMRWRHKNVPHSGLIQEVNCSDAYLILHHMTAVAWRLVTGMYDIFWNSVCYSRVHNNSTVKQLFRTFAIKRSSSARKLQTIWILVSRPTIVWLLDSRGPALSSGRHITKLHAHGKSDLRLIPGRKLTN